MSQHGTALMVNGDKENCEVNCIRSTSFASLVSNRHETDRHQTATAVDYKTIESRRERELNKSLEGQCGSFPVEHQKVNRTIHKTRENYTRTNQNWALCTT